MYWAKSLGVNEPLDDFGDIRSMNNWEPICEGKEKVNASQLARLHLLKNLTTPGALMCSWHPSRLPLQFVRQRTGNFPAHDNLARHIV